VAVDSTGNVFVADTLNDLVRQIWPAGGVSTLAGTGGTPGSAAGPGASAQFFHPAGVACGSTGTVYVADALNSAIRKIAITVSGQGPSPTITTAWPGARPAVSIQISSVPEYMVLNCPETIQAHSQWCGMASCTCILDYLGASLAQCDVVNYTMDIDYACGSENNTNFYWGDPVANIAINYCMGPRPSETDTMAHFGHPCTGRFSALTFAEIQTEILANRPFIMFWEPSVGSDDHLLVGLGYDTSNGQQNVIVMNPDPGYGIMPITYGYACDNDHNGGSSWGRTLTLDP
jgi:hypothetical protein